MSYLLRNILIGYLTIVAIALLIFFRTFSTLTAQEAQQITIRQARTALQTLQPTITNLRELEFIYAHFYLSKIPSSRFQADYRIQKIEQDALQLQKLHYPGKPEDQSYLQLANALPAIIGEFNTSLGQLAERPNDSTGGNRFNLLVHQFIDKALQLEIANRNILNKSYSESIAFTRRTFAFVRLILAILLLILLISFGFLYRDIRNRRKTEQQLKAFNLALEDQVQQKTAEIIASEDRYRSIIEQATDAIFITDLNGKLLDVNSAFLKTFGYTGENLTGRNIADFIAAADLEQWPLPLDRLQAGETLFSERRMLHRNGQPIPTETNTKLLPDGRLLSIARDATERQKAAARFIHEKNLSDSLINSLPGVFFIQEVEGRLLRWNQALQANAGISPELIGQLTVYDFFEGDEKETIRNAINRVIQFGSAQTEAIVRLPSGKTIPYFFTGQLMEYEGRQCVIGTGIDIAERKNAEAESEQMRLLLKERIKELTTLYRCSQLLQREDLPLQELLQELVTLLPYGWQHNEIAAARISCADFELHTPNYGPGRHAQSARFPTPDGSEGLVEIVYLEERPIVGEDAFYPEERHLINMVAEMLQLFFARKQQAEALRQSEANLHTIFDTTDTIYFLLDNQLNVISCNQQARDFTEKELHFDLEKNRSDFMRSFTPDRQPFLAEWMQKALPGDHVVYELNYPQPNHTQHWYYVRMFPISGKDEKVFGLMLALSDITEKKRQEQEVLGREVQQQKKMTRAVLKAQERERNKIAQELHDNVNQILASTKLYLGMAVNEPANSAEMVKSALGFVEDAIAEIRLLSSKEVSPLKEINLKELVGALMDTLSANSIIESHLNYEVNDDASLDDDLKLNIYRIVQEQVANLMRHSQATHALIDIRQSNRMISLSFEDNGIGFDTTRSRKGIGISNMINRVESYNGTIDINSQPGKGLRIAISIPIGS